MSMFRLEYGSDITCPHCKQKFDVRWNTEYGDPLFGEHKAECLNCNKEFDFGVYIQYTQPGEQ